MSDNQNGIERVYGTFTPEQIKDLEEGLSPEERKDFKNADNLGKESILVRHARDGASQLLAQSLDSGEIRRERIGYKQGIMDGVGVTEWKKVPVELQELYLTEPKKVQKALDEGTLQQLINPAQEPTEPQEEPVEEESPLGKTPSELSEVERGRLEFMAVGIGAQTEQGIVDKTVDRVLDPDQPMYPTQEMDKRVYEKQKKRTDNLVQKARNFGIESELIDLILPESVETIEKDEEQYVRDNTKEFPDLLKQTEKEQTEIDKKGLRYALEKIKTELAEQPAEPPQALEQEVENQESAQESAQEPANPPFLEKRIEEEPETPSSEEIQSDLVERMSGIYEKARAGGATDTEIKASLDNVGILIMNLVQKPMKKAEEKYKALEKKLEEIQEGQIPQESIEKAVVQYLIDSPEALSQGLTEEQAIELFKGLYEAKAGELEGRVLRSMDTKDHGVPQGHLNRLEARLDKKYEGAAERLSKQLKKSTDEIGEKVKNQIPIATEEYNRREGVQQAIADKVPKHMLPIQDKDVETVLKYEGAIRNLNERLTLSEQRVAQLELEAQSKSYTQPPQEPATQEPTQEPKYQEPAPVTPSDVSHLGKARQGLERLGILKGEQ